MPQRGRPGVIQKIIRLAQQKISITHQRTKYCLKVEEGNKPEEKQYPDEHEDQEGCLYFMIRKIGIPDSIQREAQEAKDDDDRVKDNNIMGNKVWFLQAGLPAGDRSGEEVERDIPGDETGFKGRNESDGMMLARHCMRLYYFWRGCNGCQTESKIQPSPLSLSPVAEDHMKTDPDHEDHKEQFDLLRRGCVCGADTQPG